MRKWLTLAALLFPAAALALAPSQYWRDYYSPASYGPEGALLPPGALVQVYDPQGVECGRYEVGEAGTYGYLHVYGDDPLTATDEGAVAGDELRFTVDGEAYITDPPVVVWESGDKMQYRADLYHPSTRRLFAVGVSYYRSGTPVPGVGVNVTKGDSSWSGATDGSGEFLGGPIMFAGDYPATIVQPEGGGLFSGVVTSYDASLVLQHVFSGADLDRPHVADVDGEGGVAAYDAMWMISRALRRIPGFPNVPPVWSEPDTAIVTYTVVEPPTRAEFTVGAAGDVSGNWHAQVPDPTGALYFAEAAALPGNVAQLAIVGEGLSLEGADLVFRVDTSLAFPTQDPVLWHLNQGTPGAVDDWRFSGDTMRVSLAMAAPSAVEDDTILVLSMRVRGTAPPGAFAALEWVPHPQTHVNEAPAVLRDGWIKVATPDTTPPAFTVTPTLVEIGHENAVLAWANDEPTAGLVRFGTAPDALDRTAMDGFTRFHQIELPGLTAATKYYYSIVVSDARKNISPAWVDSFVTRAAPDTEPPRFLTKPLAIPGDTYAGFVWRGDELHTAAVRITIPGEFTPVQTVFIEEPKPGHVIRVDGLEPSTQYRGRVAIMDVAGNITASPPKPVRTRAAPDLTPPRLTRFPMVVYASDTRVALAFSTDEPSVATLKLFTEGYPAGEFSSEDLTRRHTLIVDGLTPSTQYTFELSIRDYAGNTAVFPEPSAKIGRASAGRRGANISTSATPDNDYPVIVSPPTVTARTTKTLVIQWETDEPANSVLRYGSAGAKLGRTAGLGNTVVSGQFVSQHTIVLTGLSANTSYEFQAAATDANGNGETVSSQLTTTTLQSEDFTPPNFLEQPTTVTASDTRLSLRFVTDEPADARVLYRVSGSEGVFEEVYLPELEAERIVTLTNLEAATTYDVSVEASDVVGNTGTSVATSATTTAAPDDAEPVISQGPGVLAEDTRVTVSWTTDEPSDSRVEFGTTEALGGFAATSELTTEHSIVVTGLDPSTSYFFAAFSADASGNEADSSGAALTFTTLATADTDPPAQVTGLAAEAGASQAAFTWTANSEADLAGYRIERATAGGAFAVIADGITQTSFRDVDLAAGTAYQYRVSAVDASSNRNVGPASAPADVTPSLANVPGPPTIMPQPDPAPAEPLLGVTNATAGPRPTAGYTFVVAMDENLTEIAVTGTGIAEGEETTAWQVPFPLEHGDRYWWAARAVDDGGFAGPFSAINSFIADTNEVVSVELVSLQAVARAANVLVSWTITGAETARWHVWRSVAGGEYQRLTNDALVTGRSGRFIDGAPPVAGTASYLLELIEGAGSRFFGPVAAEAFRPAELVFQRNVPNPFNPSTMLRFGLPAAGHVRLTVYNVAGQRVATLVDRPMAAGFHTLRWNGEIDGGRAAGSGVYLLRLVHRAGDGPEEVRLQRVLLAK